MAHTCLLHPFYWTLEISSTSISKGFFKVRYINYLCEAGVVLKYAPLGTVACCQHTSVVETWKNVYGITLGLVSRVSRGNGCFLCKTKLTFSIWRHPGLGWIPSFSSSSSSWSQAMMRWSCLCHYTQGGKPIYLLARVPVFFLFRKFCL